MILFNKTQLGMNMYAIGGNREAAIVSGVNVIATLIILYAIAGALYGTAGVLEAARTGGATNNYGNMYELDAIAACVVGESPPPEVWVPYREFWRGCSSSGYQLRTYLYRHQSLLAAHREGAYHRGGGLLRYP